MLVVLLIVFSFFFFAASIFCCFLLTCFFLDALSCLLHEDSALRGLVSLIAREPHNGRTVILIPRLEKYACVGRLVISFRRKWDVVFICRKEADDQPSVHLVTHTRNLQLWKKPHISRRLPD